MARLTSLLVLLCAVCATAQYYIVGQPYFYPVIYGYAPYGRYYGGGYGHGCGYGGCGRGYGRKVLEDQTQKSCDTVKDIVARQGDLSELNNVIQRAGVSDALQNEFADRSQSQQYTFLLPNNAAINGLRQSIQTMRQQQNNQQGMNQNQNQMPHSIDELLNNKTALTAILSYHILDGSHPLESLRQGQTEQTQLGSGPGPLTVTRVAPGTATFKGASNDANGTSPSAAKAVQLTPSAVVAEYKTCKGVALVVDHVLLPVRMQ